MNRYIADGIKKESLMVTGNFDIEFIFNPSNDNIDVFKIKLFESYINKYELNLNTQELNLTLINYFRTTGIDFIVWFKQMKLNIDEYKFDVLIKYHITNVIDEKTRIYKLEGCLFKEWPVIVNDSSESGEYDTTVFTINFDNIKLK